MADQENDLTICEYLRGLSAQDKLQLAFDLLSEMNYDQQIRVVLAIPPFADPVQCPISSRLHLHSILGHTATHGRQPEREFILWSGDLSPVTVMHILVGMAHHWDSDMLTTFHTAVFMMGRRRWSMNQMLSYTMHPRLTESHLFPATSNETWNVSNAPNVFRTDPLSPADPMFRPGVLPSISSTSAFQSLPPPRQINLAMRPAARPTNQTTSESPQVSLQCPAPPVTSNLTLRNPPASDIQLIVNICGT